MRTIRTILVDDERVGRSRLRRMLKNESDFEIVAECSHGLSAVEAIAEHEPDLLFLDINMPGLDGFGVLDTLGPERQPRVVIFVTAYDEHAVRAFEACALDYLLKPASPARLGKALSRAREHLLTVASPSHLPAVPDQAAGISIPPSLPATAPHRFTVRSGGRMSFIAPEEIDWVEAAGNYAILHVGAQNHMVRETMNGLERQLAAAGRFLRVSRSAILNLVRVKELYASPVGDPAAILVDGQRVHVTRPLRKIAERLTAP